MPAVIHVSPHPDDESIAASCTLLALKKAGWRVVNLAVSYGRPEHGARRAAELRSALEVAGFDLEEPTRPIPISRGDDLRHACWAVTDEVARVVRQTGAELVVGPHPRDGHHGHVAVARGIRQAVWASPTPLTWWMWSIWADLPRPTLIVDCDQPTLAQSELMVKQYAGETGRNDYAAIHAAVRRVNAVKGMEKAFGFGATPVEWMRKIEHAELLTEVAVRKKRWMVGPPRVLDPAGPLLAEQDWGRLDDLSILSPTLLRPVFRPWLLALFAGRRVPFWPTAADPPPRLDLARRNP